MCKSVERVIARAEENGIGIALSAGVDFKSNRKILELIERYDIVKGALGIYPIEALKMSLKGIDDEIEFIKSNEKKVFAIGEVGLDFKENVNREDWKIQESIFLKFIKLAKELDKPLIVHSRKAEERCVELLEKEMCKKVVMHCFCGGLKLAERIVENGWFLSIPASINYNKGFQQIVRAFPIASLLCETDSPFLHPLRERDNEPINVIASYKKIAEIKNISMEKAEKEIEENFKRLFKSIN
jgi:TatD DNase family protein